jgi:hypothetical protein
MMRSRWFAVLLAPLWDMCTYGGSLKTRRTRACGDAPLVCPSVLRTGIFRICPARRCQRLLPTRANRFARSSAS